MPRSPRFARLARHPDCLPRSTCDCRIQGETHASLIQSGMSFLLEFENHSQHAAGHCLRQGPSTRGLISLRGVALDALLVSRGAFGQVCFHEDGVRT